MVIYWFQWRYSLIQLNWYLWMNGQVAVSGWLRWIFRKAFRVRLIILVHSNGTSATFEWIAVSYNWTSSWCVYYLWFSCINCVQSTLHWCHPSTRSRHSAIQFEYILVSIQLLPYNGRLAVLRMIKWN